MGAGTDVAVAVGASVGVAVGVGVGAGLVVGVGVGEGTGVGAGEDVGVGVNIAVGVGVGSRAGVGVSPPPQALATSAPINSKNTRAIRYFMGFILPLGVAEETSSDRIGVLMTYGSESRIL